MLLFLCVDKKKLDPLLSYLEKNDIAFKAIEFHALVNNVKMVTHTYDDIYDTKFVVDDEAYDIQASFTGIYHELAYLTLDAVTMFQAKDQKYAYAEWRAYLQFILYKCQNSINPVRHEFFTASFYRFPILFHYAKKCGLITPRYYISTDENEIERHKKTGSFITLHSLENVYLLDVLPESGPVLLEYMRGAPIVCTVIGSKIFSYIQYAEGHEVFLLSESMRRKLINLMKTLNLVVGHLFLKRALNGELILYSVTGRFLPSLCLYNSDNIFKELVDLLCYKIPACTQ